MANMRPYDVAISNAIERGDARRLEAAINQAKELHEKQGGDLGAAIKKGEAALKKLEKGGGYGASSKSGGGSKSKGKK
jgi:hypothetical protein